MWHVVLALSSAAGLLLLGALLDRLLGRGHLGVRRPASLHGAEQEVTGRHMF